MSIITLNKYTGNSDLTIKFYVKFIDGNVYRDTVYTKVFRQFVSDFIDENKFNAGM